MFYVFSLGSMPFFASRAFLSIFLIAWASRLQSDGNLSFVGDFGALKAGFLLDAPAWFIADQALLLFFALAAVEVMADKNPYIAEILALFDGWAKSFGNFVATSVVTPTAVVGLASVAVPVAYAAFGLNAFWSLLIAGGVWLIAQLRRSVLGLLREADEDDDLGLQRLISWAEDGWVAGGMLFLVLLPVFTLIVAGLTVAGLFVFERIMRAREEKEKLPCGTCGHRNSPAAPSCARCKSHLPMPRKIGLFGAKQTAATDLALHRLELLGRRRCLHCAERLPERKLAQSCKSCGAQVMPSREWAESYLTYLDKKLPKTLGICLALSFVPVLGLIPGIIYYRFSLISSLRAYIPAVSGCFTRFGVRFLNLLLLAFQWVPVFGAVVLPVMCYLNYQLFRRKLAERMQLELGSAHAAPARLISS